MHTRCSLFYMEIIVGFSFNQVLVFAIKMSFWHVLLWLPTLHSDPALIDGITNKIKHIIWTDKFAVYSAHEYYKLATISAIKLLRLLHGYWMAIVISLFHYVVIV